MDDVEVPWTRLGRNSWAALNPFSFSHYVNSKLKSIHESTSTPGSGNRGGSLVGNPALRATCSPSLCVCVCVSNGRIFQSLLLLLQRESCGPTSPLRILAGGSEQSVDYRSFNVFRKEYLS